jgi:hypothetical protein
VEFYKNLSEANPCKGAKLANGVWDSNNVLDDNDKIVLSSPYLEKYIIMAIGGMKTESAPGPNGFTILFFKKLWPVIKKELMRMVIDFNGGKLDLKRLNYGVITLVQKIKEANTIRQYKPICLLNVDFKIFPKLMTDRITPRVGKWIDESQTAFIKGRNILEGVVILHEVIHEFKRSSSKGVLFKINFEKAYCKVRWSFVQQVLEEKGFPRSWVHQAMNTIQGGGFA